MVTLDVSKVDKSKVVNEEQLKNIDSILLTEEVSNFEKSKLFTFIHVLNMPFIETTFEVLKSIKFIVVKDIQF